MSLTTFMFHDIRNYSKSIYEKRYDFDYFLTIDEFIDKINYLNNNYVIVTPSYFPAINFNDDYKYAVLTFDDGLLDHYNLLPILKTYNIKGVFFIPVNCVISSYILPSHKIQFIISNTNIKTLTHEILLRVNLNNRDYEFKKYSISRFKNNIWSKELTFITNFLREPYHEDIVNELFNKYVTIDEKTFNEEFYIKIKHVVELINSGMEIGSHGFKSSDLSKSSYKEQEYEIEQSFNFLDIMIKNDRMFSYPNGNYNNKTLELLKQHDCKYAFTTRESIVTDNNINLLEIPRKNISRSKNE